jgi:hypothetical protein
MPQIFHYSTNYLAPVSLLGVAAAPALILVLASQISRSPYNTKVAVPLDQPAPFSHEHHVTELGIDCRYCHGNVEKSKYAGVPATQTCMSCHSQIWTNSPLLEPVRESYRNDTPIVWNLVNKVPDFVYFNHSIHVNRGINCNVCHGPVQKMMLTYKGNSFQMGWCLECHRAPENYLYTSEESKKKGLTPREQVFDVYWRYQNGLGTLSPREQALMEGKGFTPSAQERAEGKELVNKYGVNTKQLEDCWICHR